MSKGWIGVDLDGTLAEWHGWHDDGGIGEPIPLMVERVKKWLAQGQEVRIMTARVGASGKWSPKAGRPDDQEFADYQRKCIEAWCVKHLGQIIPVTATKDMDMLCLYDDRAAAVEKNTGRVFSFREEFGHSTED